MLGFPPYSNILDWFFIGLNNESEITMSNKNVLQFFYYFILHLWIPNISLFNQITLAN